MTADADAYAHTTAVAGGRRPNVGWVLASRVYQIVQYCISILLGKPLLHIVFYSPTALQLIVAHSLVLFVGIVS